MSGINADEWRISPEQAKAIRTRQRKPAARKVVDELFSPVTLSMLTDPRLRRVFSPADRLYHFLIIRSFDNGWRPIQLTNTMAAEIGLGRSTKSRALKILQAAGLVAALQVGRSAPAVLVVRCEK